MRPLAVAVTGGIGAGKSEALRAFARRGVPTLSADDVVHRLIAEDPDVRAALEERLHPRVRAAEEAWFAGLDAEVAVTEIPLLYEVGGESRFDAVVVITAP